MLLLTNIVFIVGILAVVASWTVAVRLINSDKAGGQILGLAPTAPDRTLSESHVS